MVDCVILEGDFGGLTMQTIVIDPKRFRIVPDDRQSEIVKSVTTAAGEGQRPGEEKNDDGDDAENLPEAQLLQLLVRYFKAWNSGNGEGFTERKEGETTDDFVKRLTEQMAKDHPDVVESVGGEEEFKAWVAVACKYDGGGGDDVTIPEWELDDSEVVDKEKKEETMKGVWGDMAEKSVRIPEITMKAEEAADLIEIELERYVCEWHSGNMPYFCYPCVPIPMSMDGTDKQPIKPSAEEFARKCADELLSRITYRDDMLLAMRSKGGVKKFRKWLNDTILSLAKDLEGPEKEDTNGNGGAQPDVTEKK